MSTLQWKGCIEGETCKHETNSEWGASQHELFKFALWKRACKWFSSILLVNKCTFHTVKLKFYWTGMQKVPGFTLVTFWAGQLFIEFSTGRCEQMFALIYVDICSECVCVHALDWTLWTLQIKSCLTDMNRFWLPSSWDNGFSLKVIHSALMCVIQQVKAFHKDHKERQCKICNYNNEEKKYIVTRHMKKCDEDTELL